MKAVRNTVRNIVLVFFILLAIFSIFFVFKYVFLEGGRIEALFSKKTKDPIFIVNKDLENSVELTIGSETTKFGNEVFALMVELRNGEVQLFTSKEFSRFDEKDAYQHGDIIEGNNSLKNLILQTATASSNAYAARLCCVGPYTNANGAVVARSCQVHLSDICP